MFHSMRRSSSKNDNEAQKGVPAPEIQSPPTDESDIDDVPLSQLAISKNTPRAVRPNDDETTSEEDDDDEDGSVSGVENQEVNHQKLENPSDLVRPLSMKPNQGGRKPAQNGTANHEMPPKLSHSSLSTSGSIPRGFEKRTLPYPKASRNESSSDDDSSSEIDSTPSAVLRGPNGIPPGAHDTERNSSSEDSDSSSGLDLKKVVSIRPASEIISHKQDLSGSGTTTATDSIAASSKRNAAASHETPPSPVAESKTENSMDDAHGARDLLKVERPPQLMPSKTQSVPLKTSTNEHGAEKEQKHVCSRDITSYSLCFS